MPNPFLSLLPSIVPYTNPNEVRLKERGLDIQERGMNLQNDIENRKLAQLEAIQRAQLEAQNREISNNLAVNNSRIQQGDTQFAQHPGNIEAWEMLEATRKNAGTLSGKINNSYSKIAAITEKYGVEEWDVKKILDNPSQYTATEVDAAQAINKEKSLLEQYSMSLGKADAREQMFAYEGIAPSNREKFTLYHKDPQTDMVQLMGLLKEFFGEGTGKKSLEERIKLWEEQNNK